MDSHILIRWPELMVYGNSQGDVPIHSALKTGIINIVVIDALISWLQQQHATGNIYTVSHVLEQRDIEGNTALHIALELFDDEHRIELATKLVDLYPGAIYVMNEGICPLYLAIKMELQGLVKHMLQKLQPFKEDALDHLTKGQSVLHVAVSSQRTAILTSIMDTAPELLDSIDSEGRSPLSYAVFSSYNEGVKLILEKYPDVEFKRDKDKDGSFPIHQAMKGNYIKVVELLRPMCLLNNKGQNILHVAAENNKLVFMMYMVRLQEFKDLIYAADKNGDTALDLAVKGLPHKDQLNIKMLLIPRYHMTHSDVKGLSSLLIYLMQVMMKLIESSERIFKIRQNRQKRREPINKERANILLLVATLIITVTFTAAFSPPGGYNEKTGMPNLYSCFLFQDFMMYDWSSLACSIWSAVFIFLGMLVKPFAEMFLVVGGYHIYLGLHYMIKAFLIVIQLYNTNKESKTMGCTRDTFSSTIPTSMAETIIEGLDIIIGLFYIIGSNTLVLQLTWVIIAPYSYPSDFYNTFRRVLGGYFNRVVDI